MSEYRKFVVRSAKTILPEDRLIQAAFNLCINTGEFANIINQHEFQEQDLNKEQAIRKLGDIRWFLEYSCHVLGVSMEEIEQKNIERVKLKQPEEFD
jgi:hypothetical protein